MNTPKDLTQEQIKLLPTEQEIQQYETLGWYISPIVIPEHIIDESLKGAMSFLNGNVDFEHPDIKGPANDSNDGVRTLTNNEFASLQKKEIKDLVNYPIVSAIAAKLSRTEEVRLFADALMCKFPEKENNSSAFGWHTDKAYWPSCTSNDMLTAWIPLQDVTIDMGPMIVIENSHKWELDTELKKYCAAGNKDLQGLESYLEKSGKEYKYIPMTLKKGQLSFHNGNSFHASSVNKSNLNRVTLTIHMQDKKNVYKAAYNDKNEKIIIGYERMCRKDSNGNPDYRDPKIFPVLWEGKL